MEKVPAVFSDYVDKLSAYSVTLVYSDGSEKLLDGEDSNYSLTVSYEDRRMRSKTFTKSVMLLWEVNRKELKIRRRSFWEGLHQMISTEAMTTLILQGKKK
ncbi:MAG: hypothetical protein ACLVB1_14690 [Blautia obeum]